MRRLLYILCIIATMIPLGSIGQNFVLRTNGTFTPTDPRLNVPWNLYIPRVCDTTTALMGGKDTLGAIVFDTCNHKVWIRDGVGNAHRWIETTTLYTGDGTLPTDRIVTANANTLTITGSAAFTDGAQFDVITSGSVGIAIRGQSTDGRGVMGLATTGVGVYGSATGAGGYGLFGTSSGSGGNAIYGSTISGLVLEGAMNPTSTNTVIPAISLTRSSQSAGANNIGQSIDFYNHTSTTDQLANQLVSKWTDATITTRTSQFEIYGVNSAVSARKVALAGTGQWIWDGYGGGTFTGTAASMLATTSGGSVIEVPVNLTGSATLDFPNTSAGTSSDLTITVTGAADGDVVAIGVPNGSTVANGCFTAWVSATNTVTIRYTNNDLVTAFNPASGTFKATILKH